MANKAQTIKTILKKLPAGVFLGLIGIVFGHIVGALFGATAVGPADLEWTPIFEFFGGLAGFLSGFLLDLED